MSWFDAFIIALIEGITEFLPVSSTGHMILTSSLMGIEKDTFTKLFEISIQLGAILSVVVLYWRKFFDFSKWQFYLKLLISVIPALILGKLFSDKIDLLLESPLTVAFSLLGGGIVLLFIDNIFKNPVITDEKNINFKEGFIIGIWQCLAMIPGISRSAASIVGGMQQKLTRKTAAEFSFFLAVPTMFAATVYKMAGSYTIINADNIGLLIFGNIIAFIVALLAIKAFIGFLTKHGFKMFGYYRIIVGLIFIILILSGIDLKI